jgi:hypothetical protein
MHRAHPQAGYLREEVRGSARTALAWINELARRARHLGLVLVIRTPSSGQSV